MYMYIYICNVYVYVHMYIYTNYFISLSIPNKCLQEFINSSPKIPLYSPMIQSSSSSKGFGEEDLELLGRIHAAFEYADCQGGELRDSDG